MLLEVYRCVQLKRWSVVCGCVLQRGQRGEGWCVSSTLCRYDIRMGLLLVLNWARVRRVSLGRESSEGEILGACWCISLLWLPLFQLTTDIETIFKQRKPPHRTVCVAIDLTAAFDPVSHDKLISKIVGSSLLPAITRWLSCYLRGRQAATSFRGDKSSTRIVRTGVPQGSKLSPSLFNYYIADMPRLTPPVKRDCYADDITVWATSAAGVHDQQLPERCKHLPG